MSSNCPVCLERIRGNDVAALPCGHVYDRHCVIAWIIQSESCAVCREPCKADQILHLFYTHDGGENLASKNSRGNTNYEFEFQAEETEVLKSKIKQYALSETRLLEVIDTYKTRHNNLSNQLNDLRKKLELHAMDPLKEQQLKNEIKEKDEALARKIRDVASLKNKNKTLTLKSRQLELFRSNSDRKSDSLQAENNTLKNLIVDLHKKIDIHVKNENPLKELVARTQTQLRNVKMKEIYLINSHENALNKIAVLEEEIAGLQVKLTEKDDLCSALGELNVSLEKENEEAKKNTELMAKSYTELLEENEKCVKNLMVLNKKITGEDGKSKWDPSEYQRDSNSWEEIILGG